MAITSESEPRVPTDLRKVLAASARAKAQWSDLTPIARRDFISWIESAKQPPKAKAQWKDLTPNERRDFVDWIDSAKESDMRTQRIEKVCVMLLSGKRHP